MLDAWEMNRRVFAWIRENTVLWLVLFQMVVFFVIVVGFIWGSEWLWWEVLLAPPEVLGLLLVVVFAGGVGFGKWLWSS